jgi:hypothetical protein
LSDRRATGVRAGAAILASVDMDEALLADRASAAPELAEEEFRTWAASQRVFVSSVMGDLAEERLAVAERIG